MWFQLVENSVYYMYNSVKEVKVCQIRKKKRPAPNAVIPGVIMYVRVDGVLCLWVGATAVRPGYGTRTRTPRPAGGFPAVPKEKKQKKRTAERSRPLFVQFSSSQYSSAVRTRPTADRDAREKSKISSASARTSSAVTAS